MKNKSIFSIFLCFLFLFNISYGAEIHKDKLDSGVIGVSHNESGKVLKVIIKKASQKYTYSLRNDGTPDYYPLQLGSGSYDIMILKNTSGKKYSVLKSEKIDAQIKDKNKVYLNPIQLINFSKTDPAIQKASKLADKDSVYQYIVKNIKYDYNKASIVKPGYYPVINDTFKTSKGICYDYSSLDAAMLRSLGIPTKLVKGYSKGVDGYHAWNEVFINGQWYVVDTTYDAGKKINSKKILSKKNSDYKKIYEY